MKIIFFSAMGYLIGYAILHFVILPMIKAVLYVIFPKTYKRLKNKYK